MARLCIFTTAYDPFIGGAEIALKEIAARLTEHQCVIITARLSRDVPAEERAGHILIQRVGPAGARSKYLLPFFGAQRALALHRADPFDLVWSVMASYNSFAALFFRYFCRRPAPPWLLTLQEGDSFTHIYSHVWWCWPFFRQIFTHADGLQAISSYLLQWGTRMGFSKKAVVIPNGVDLPRFAAPCSPEERVQVRRELSTTMDAPVFITTSRLVPKNGVGDVIRALTHVPKAFFWIVGDGELRNDLEHAVQSQGVAERVRFLGSRPYQEIPRYLHSANYFIRVSHSEGMGNVFVEAMAAGLPVIASNVGGIPDVVHDKENGLYAKPGDTEDIARVMKKLMDDPALFARLVESGKRSVSNYSYDRIAEDMRSFINKILISGSDEGGGGGGCEEHPEAERAWFPTDPGDTSGSVGRARPRTSAAGTLGRPTRLRTASPATALLHQS